MLYLYDMTYEGYLSAVFEVYTENDEEPSFVPAGVCMPVSLLGEKHVRSDACKARRVETGLKKLAPDLHERVYYAWLSREDGMDDTLFCFIRLAFAGKKDPSSMLYEQSVKAVVSAARKVSGERHRYLQFVRFLRAGEGCYIADIEPSYDILALIANHFVQRFATHCLILRDRVRGKAMVWDKRSWFITDDPALQKPPLPKDTEYEDLWRGYFKALSIPARRNLKLQAHFIPKRYRKYLTEMPREDEPDADYFGPP